MVVSPRNRRISVTISDRIMERAKALGRLHRVSISSILGYWIEAAEARLGANFCGSRRYKKNKKISESLLDK